MSLRAIPVMPSTTTNGAALLRVPRPRTVMLWDSKPGVLPPELVTVSPAARPARALVAFVTGRFSSFAEFMEDTAPVKSVFRCVAYPTTTTSVVGANPT